MSNDLSSITITKSYSDLKISVPIFLQLSITLVWFPADHLVRLFNRIWNYLSLAFYIFAFIWHICFDFRFLLVQVIPWLQNQHGHAWTSWLFMDTLMNFNHGNFVTFYSFWITFGTQYNLYIFEIQLIYFSTRWRAIETFQSQISHTFFMILFLEYNQLWKFWIDVFEYTMLDILLYIICDILLMCILHALIMNVQNIMSANSFNI